MTMNRNPQLPPSFPDFLFYYKQQESIKRKDSSNPSSSRKLHNQHKKTKKNKKKIPVAAGALPLAPLQKGPSLFTLFSLSLSLSLSLCVHTSVVMLF
jgi:hypothetical protein